ncbi:transcriptional regulator, IclR family [Austwickia chelonae]|uniref:Glycerol operon regulatory protein n=1 Tax=Austwickia chelonae NBRC 105200 TaxID=1184607 RepID=K6VT03_9MICO|nr:IclR family transcriptional regulator [Austwickia chelonae]GAB78470.1 putative IclR family transcriptional regulator [Austwickia chelonae NBRC 105200]SEW39886.1 transcriptional regulator, IclR family [Austwickia chelonae]
MTGPVPAAQHTLDVLLLLSRHVEPLPAAAMARDLGLPRSTMYKLLGTLTSRGFVTHLPESRRYALGPAAFELGTAYTRQAPLARIGRPLVARLVESLGETAHLAVLHGRDVIYVVEQRAPRRPPLVSDVDVRLPAGLTASGLAMLAELPAAQVRALFPDTSSFVTRHEVGPRSLRELRALLRDIRQNGYAHERDSVTPGFESVGVAVRDRHGHPVASLAATWPSDALEIPVDDVVTRLRAAAGDLGRRVGGLTA